jgi:CubicO group peptidase (beta-lactamase class C family)
VARSGKIVWHKAYGNYTYDSTAQAVSPESIYDLASITKVAATTLEVMHLTENGRLDISRPASAYIPELLQTNKKSLTIESMLIHQTGLQAWIPFYQNTLDNQKPAARWYNALPVEDFQVPVAERLYMRNGYVDSIWAQIFRSELRPDKTYKYSDLGLYLTERAIRNASGTTLDTYVREQFYQPLGLATTTFNPWKNKLIPRCVPTEDDYYFRQQRLQGYVHDMGAAMLGGVSGHAGLFSNANDLAKIFQMLLNKGHYFGKTYLQPATVERFAMHYPGSTRRGIGVDMKELDTKATQNMCEEASPATFGHTGFTGNAVWADPEHQLIFIFLSNRTFPSMNNNKLINGNYRPRLQQIAYRAIADYGVRSAD